MNRLVARLGFFAKTTTKLGVLGGALWLGGLAWFYGHLNPIAPPASLHTDGIVVLTGGQNRLETGFDLMQADAAGRMLVSGVHPDTGLDDLRRRLRRDITGVEPRIDLGKAALDTVGNANEAAAWAHDHGFHALRIVTSNYHLPRAMVELRRAMPDIKLLPHPVRPIDHGAPGIVTRPLAFGFIVLEYHKYLFSLARARLTGELTRPIDLAGDFVSEAI